MSKKLIFLISFVLVASLAGNALALDRLIPDFAGGPTAAAVLWEFDDGNAASSEPKDYPTIILYNAPEPPDSCFGFRNYGWGYEGGPDPNNRFIWNTNGTVVCPGEESVCQPIPAGEGSNLTVQFQVTWQGPNYPGQGPALGIEIWGSYPNAVPVDDLREGDWYDGIGNEEGTIDLEPLEEVNNVEGVWKHTTYRHTFENIDEAVTHTNIIFFGYEQGTAGLLIDEIVVDMVVHDGDTPLAGPGRPWLRIPRAGQARNPDPANNEEHVLPDVNLAWSPDPCLLGPLDYDVWFGTDSNMANNAKIASNIDPCTVDPCAGDLAYGTTYYWRVDTNDANGAGATVLNTGIDWTFTTLGLADDESPADGEVGVSPSVILSWVEDDYASSRDIYFDTNEAAVTNATTANTALYPGVYRGSTAPVDPCDPNRNTYDPPEILDLLTDAFWRIDEINGVEGTVEGVVWSFKSAPYFVVDDFEPYANTTAVKAVWKDYWLNPLGGKNGAEVFLEYADESRINAGDKAMRYYYKNFQTSGGKPVGSEAVADISALQSGSDWNRQGIKALVLYFQGDPENGQDPSANYTIANDRMWVSVEDGLGKEGIVRYPDMNHVKEATWRDWNIELSDPCFIGVDMNDIAKVYLGFGGVKGGAVSKYGAGYTSGGDTVWFDDITLHPPRCVPSVSLLSGDISGAYSGGEDPGPTEGDCIIDYWDVLLMSGDWLLTDYEVLPVAPSDANLLVEYLFNTNFDDTAGPPYYHGVPSLAFTPTVSAGVMNVTSGGYVDVPLGASNPFDGSQDYSIFITYKSDTQDQMALITSVDPCMATTWDDPNIDTEASFLYYSPMMLYVIQAHSGGPGPDDLTFVHDNFYKAGANVDKTVQGGIGSWHHVAATYDADGGTCPDDADPNLCTPGQPTGLVRVYLDGTPGPDPANFDPNIPVDSIDDVVRICTSINALHMEDIESAPYVGDINDIRIYEQALTHAEVLYLSGIAQSTYFPNESPANLVLKDPPGEPFDPNNLDIVNFRDYEVMSSNWLDEILWP